MTFFVLLVSKKKKKNQFNASGENPLDLNYGCLPSEFSILFKSKILSSLLTTLAFESSCIEFEILSHSRKQIAISVKTGKHCVGPNSGI